MPLRDHFHPPVSKKHRWDAVHGQWPAEIVRQFFDLLPAGFQAEPKIHLGSPSEVDVSTYEDVTRGPAPAAGGTATRIAPSPTLTVEADLAGQDEYEVLVYDEDRGRQLLAAIKIVSPSNKDRPDARDKFVNKVEALLGQDVCVSVVDLVSNRRANLYAELLGSLGRSDPNLAAVPPHLYAVSVRARRRPAGLPLLDAWFYPMAVGQPLPTLPVWLSPDLRILLPLDPGYEETCRLLRIN